MERLSFRWTSISHLEAELRQQELLAEAGRRRSSRPVRESWPGLRLALRSLGLGRRSTD